MTELKKKSKDFPELQIIFMDEEAEKIPEFLIMQELSIRTKYWILCHSGSCWVIIKIPRAFCIFGMEILLKNGRA
jgi:hypothetical protein